MRASTARPTHFGETRMNAFGPRLGVAYQLDSKTVIRTGGAIYYQPPREDGNADNGIQGFGGTFGATGNFLSNGISFLTQERAYSIRHADPKPEAAHRRSADADRQSVPAEPVLLLLEDRPRALFLGLAVQHRAHPDRQLGVPRHLSRRGRQQADLPAAVAESARSEILGHLRQPAGQHDQLGDQQSRSSSPPASNCPIPATRPTCNCSRRCVRSRSSRASTATPAARTTATRRTTRWRPASSTASRRACT